MNGRFVVLAMAGGLMAAGAQADYMVGLGTTAPTYPTTLNFDEPGGPTGVVPTDAWAGIGLAELQAGDSVPVVGDHASNPSTPWVGTGNSFFGNFGVFMTFSQDLDGLSMQVWDPSGAPGPFGGGMGVFVFNDGVEVANFFGTPAWGGVGDDWLHVSATGGMLFDEVRVLGFGFIPTTYADNISWNAIPEPGALALFGAGALVAMRRRF